MASPMREARLRLARLRTVHFSVGCWPDQVHPAMPQTGSRKRRGHKGEKPAK